MDGSDFYIALKAKLSKPQRLKENNILTDLLQQVRRELAHPDEFCSERIRGTLLSFFAEFLRHFSGKRSVPVLNAPFSVEFDFLDTKKTPGYCKEIPDEFYMDMLDEFFTHSLRDNPTLKGLAESLHLSISQTQRIIKKYYGLSFRQKLLKTKIEQSKSLMASTDLSLEKISKMVGYQSYNAFFDAFRTQTGISPSDYRQATEKFHE